MNAAVRLFEMRGIVFSFAGARLARDRSLRHDG